ncbi:MAG: HAD family hydrolase [Clostridia bacterium]
MPNHLNGLLLFDFDGTVYRGEAPFRVYAAHIAEAMAETDRASYVARAARFLAGVAEVEAGDYWEAMRRLADPFHLERQVFRDAFMKTRVYMMTDDCRLEVPSTLLPFLIRVRQRVVVVLASNSPEEACVPLLEKLGLGDAFDAIRPGARKPAGLLPIIDGLVTRFSIPAGRVLSVGGHYVNDIAPARETGYRTAYITPTDYFPGPVDIAGRQLEDVLPAVEAWVDSLAP